MGYREKMEWDRERGKKQNRGDRKRQRKREKNT